MDSMILQKIKNQSAAQTGDGEIRSYEQPVNDHEDAEERKKMRAPRGKRYYNTLRQIDELSEQDEKIIEMVQALPVNNKLEGILAECRIEGCIIHAIDKWGNILNHFKSTDELGETLLPGYEAYLANPGCVSVEVYTFTICVVRDDGTVKFIDRN